MRVTQHPGAIAKIELQNGKIHMVARATGSSAKSRKYDFLGREYGFPGRGVWFGPRHTPGLLGGRLREYCFQMREYSLGPEAVLASEYTPRFWEHTLSKVKTPSHHRPLSSSYMTDERAA